MRLRTAAGTQVLGQVSVLRQRFKSECFDRGGGGWKSLEDWTQMSTFNALTRCGLSMLGAQPTHECALTMMIIRSRKDVSPRFPMLSHCCDYCRGGRYPVPPLVQLIFVRAVLKTPLISGSTSSGTRTENVPKKTSRGSTLDWSLTLDTVAKALTNLFESWHWEIAA